MKRFLCVALALLALVCILALPQSPAVADAEVAALFINVGKADAALLFLGDGRYLVDTGKSGGYEQLALALSVYGVDHLDGVLITHTDKDHVGGLKKLLKNGVTVDMIYAGTLHSEESTEEHPAYKAAEKYDVPLTWLNAGDELDWGEGFTARVLGPLTLDPTNENNNSLVVDLVTPQGNMLLTGDMELEEEGELLEAGLIPQAAVLKVGHHGDGDATSRELVQAVKPQWSIISTSTADEPDTPDGDVLATLWAAKSGVAVTQDAGLGILVKLSGGTATAEQVDLK